MSCPLNALDNWDLQAHELAKDQYGVWSIVIPAVAGKAAIPHDSRIKVCNPQEVCALTLCSFR